MNIKELIFGGNVKTASGGGAYRDSIQAWLPIKNIISGVVITRDNRFIKILEVLPVNIYLKSPNDRQNIISSKEWENQLATFDQTLYMGCNDLTSAKYISEKCGKVTISVTNNQMPLMPLFSPVYTSTRPYSQTRSNTQRDLMQPDEVLRLDRRKCIALFQGHKPALLYKLAPEEFPDYGKLKTCRVIDYVPKWKQREDEAAAQVKEPAVTPTPPASEQQHAEAARLPEINPAEDLEYQVDVATSSDSASLGMVEFTIGGVCGEDEDSPPR